ncbi:MAG: hypothetical protein K8T26_14675 [Lentisphaerae bacterium]|nr:hypothetical protein [Lentisphaerota bacterium]
MAGLDRTGDVGPALQEAARALEAGGQGVSRYGPAESARHLCRAGSEQAFLAELIRLIRLRAAIDLSTPSWPSRPGLRGRVGSAVRRALWKLLRHQHDHTAAQVNGVLRLLTDAITFQQARLDALEHRPGGGEPR